MLYVLYHNKKNKALYDPQTKNSKTPMNRIDKLLWYTAFAESEWLRKFFSYTQLIILISITH